ncbi:MAG: DGQHR domain-containing protein DpdB [Syntrophobacter sp.]
MNATESRIIVPAVRTTQSGDVDVYAFFIPGADILRIASISRISRDEEEALQGFQRKEIKNHVRGIVEFLDQGPVLFPNAIILALSSEVEFIQARGKRPDEIKDFAAMGRLKIPVRDNGQPVAWIVDGQQRALAFSKTSNNQIPVPVVAFVSEDLNIQREQFILVNKARPLPSRLINELLPEVAAYIPRDLAPRRIPSELCNILNQDPNSPFYKMIKRSSAEDEPEAVIIDTALINVMKQSIKHPLGALAPFKAGEGGMSDLDGMYRTMLMYWTAVKETFPESWGKPPTESRLMHSAGIEAMGYLMDRIMSRVLGSSDVQRQVRESLARIAPFCAWTKGTWQPLGLRWNEIQNTPRHIRTLADLLIQYDYQGVRSK